MDGSPSARRCSCPKSLSSPSEPDYSSLTWHVVPTRFSTTETTLSGERQGVVVMLQPL